MIYESSKDYLTGRVLLIFDGNAPTAEEVHQYCSKNYGFVPSQIDVELPDEGYGGHPNPGRIRCFP